MAEARTNANSKPKLLADGASFPWAAESRRRRFSSPYSLWENLGWIKNSFFGPSRRYQGLSEYLPQHCEFNPIQPQITLAMIGDIMPAWGSEFSVSDELHEFLRGVDFLVLNLEGMISDDNWVWNSIRHGPELRRFLNELFPPSQTVVAVANNHAADCGWREFQRCYEDLANAGFIVIGRRDEPSVVLRDSVQLTCGTEWSNQHCEYISSLEAAEQESRRAPFCVLYPHWGYELHLYPHPRQIARARSLLGQWDMIVGHHSHCPQPITREGNRLIAYSLGDFVFGGRDQRYHHGIILRTTIGPDVQGNWQIGTVDWRFSRLESVTPQHYRVRINTIVPFGISVAGTEEQATGKRIQKFVAKE